MSYKLCYINVIKVLNTKFLLHNKEAIVAKYFLNFQLYFRVVVLLYTTLFVFGCASVSIRAVKDPSFSDSINKLFVILNHRNLDNIDSAYTPLLVTALKDEFSQNGVKMTICIVNPLSLNEDVCLAEMNSYKPEGVLTIVSTGGVVAPSGGMIKIIYDASLFDTTNKNHKRVWRATIDASGGKEKRMKIMAKDLIKRLLDDKLISSEPKEKGIQL